MFICLQSQLNFSRWHDCWHTTDNDGRIEYQNQRLVVAVCLNALTSAVGSFWSVLRELTNILYHAASVLHSLLSFRTMWGHLFILYLTQFWKKGKWRIFILFHFATSKVHGVTWFFNLLLLHHFFSPCGFIIAFFWPCLRHPVACTHLTVTWIFISLLCFIFDLYGFDNEFRVNIFFQ
jgi:hypothetical protein